MILLLASLRGHLLRGCACLFCHWACLDQGNMTFARRLAQVALLMQMLHDDFAFYLMVKGLIYKATPWLPASNTHPAQAKA